MSGVKHDTDKDPWQLAPWDAFRPTLTNGALSSPFADQVPK